MTNARLLLGFDPGGDGAFGWCVAEDRQKWPLLIRAAGVVGTAQKAMDEARTHVEPTDDIAAIGIDAPMFWHPTGKRAVDKVVRDAVRDRGAGSRAGGTVQNLNSLQGACVVQGMMLGLLYRQDHPLVPITESHPKAMLWMLKGATKPRRIGEIVLRDLVNEFVLPPGIGGEEHVRDAALATLSCWAMVQTGNPPGWENLFSQEKEPMTPIGHPIAYWMPIGDAHGEFRGG